MSSCPICLEPELKEPAACVPCGHTFCYSCITRWTQDNQRFSFSLCPQCRTPVRQVQKLFISDWPVASSTGSHPSPPSPSEQVSQIVAILFHFFTVPYTVLANYLPEWLDLVYRTTQEFLQQLVVWRQQAVDHIVRWYGVWCELDAKAKLIVFGALALMVLLILEDLSHEGGIQQSVLLPILSLLAHTASQFLMLIGYLIFRPLVCCWLCLAEVVSAIADMAQVTLLGFLFIMYDMLCLPLFLILAVGRFVHNVVLGCMGLMRFAMFIFIVGLIFNSQAVVDHMNVLMATIAQWAAEAELRQQQQQQEQQQEQQDGQQDEGSSVDLPQQAEASPAQPDAVPDSHVELETVLFPILREGLHYVQRDQRVGPIVTTILRHIAAFAARHTHLRVEGHGQAPGGHVAPGQGAPEDEFNNQGGEAAGNGDRWGWGDFGAESGMDEFQDIEEHLDIFLQAAET